MLNIALPGKVRNLIYGNSFTTVNQENRHIKKNGGIKKNLTLMRAIFHLYSGKTSIGKRLPD